MKRMHILLLCGVLMAATGVLSGCATQAQTRVVMSPAGDLVEEPAPYQQSDPCLSFLEELTYSLFKGFAEYGR
jgi:hypothetical protein